MDWVILTRNHSGEFMSSNGDLEKLFLAMKSELDAKGVMLEMPHSSIKALGTEFTHFESTKLVAKFKYNPKFNNPFRSTQGGIISAYLDEVFGPLSFLIAKRPVVTLDLNTSFIRPFVEKDEYVIVAAELVSQTKTILIMNGTVKTKDDKLIAIATTHSLILTDEQLSRKTV